MDYYFDREGFFYTVKFLILVGTVLFFSYFANQELHSYYLDIASERLLSGTPRMNLFVHTVYQELTKQDSVFLPSREVLNKLAMLKSDGEDFLFADLDQMKILYYENGEEAASFEILSKGKEESFFETPSGIYSVSSKEENHFSTIGKVWMPWSLHFFGNYFIHGWPHYPNGLPVAQSFSGGCIRLSVSDAKKLFNVVIPRTPLLIYSAFTDEKKNKVVFTEDSYFRKTSLGRAIALPKLSASAFFAVDFETGQILLSKNEKIIYSIASLTKLMSALVASEMYNGRTFKISKKILEQNGTSGSLRIGEVFANDELLYPLLLASSNGAAAVLESESREFVPSMNQKARAVGLVATSFSDASGLNPKNVSTAEELFKLLKYIYSNKKPIFDILTLKSYKLVKQNNAEDHLWENINRPNGSLNFIAGKIGYTDEALKTMIGVYGLKLSEGETRDIAIVVLHSQNHKMDIEIIAKYLVENFVYGNILAQNKELKEKQRVIFNESSIYEAVKNISN